MSQYQPKTITMSVEEYERLMLAVETAKGLYKNYESLIKSMEGRAKTQQEALENLRDHNGSLRDWLYAYKRNYEALTDKYCLPCTVGWKFSEN